MEKTKGGEKPTLTEVNASICQSPGSLHTSSRLAKKQPCAECLQDRITEMTGSRVGSFTLTSSGNRNPSPKRKHKNSPWAVQLAREMPAANPLLGPLQIIVASR